MAAVALREWGRVDRGDISGSWWRRLTSVASYVTAAQLAAAGLADPYLDSLVGAGLESVNPAALSGVAADGRTLVGLLTLPPIRALTLIGQGLQPGTAMARAAADLSMYVRSAVTDTGRQAVVAGMAARPQCGGYYRRLSPPSCVRCAILAGRWYHYSAGFLRHPHCDCVHVPAASRHDGGAYDARQAILSGQVTGLSTQAVEAIRLGADPAAVVNARRGMTTLADGRRVTTEGTTRRGLAGARMRQAGQRIRPMPEQIIADAMSRDDAIRRLQQSGYITS